MPCRSDGFDGSQPSIIKMELDIITQNLCFLCGEIEDRQQWETINNPRLKKWWREHQDTDRIRVQKKIQEMLNNNGDFSAINIAIVLIAEAEKVHPVSEWHREWFQALADQGIMKFREEKRGIQQIQTSITDKLSETEIDFILNGGLLYKR